MSITHEQAQELIQWDMDRTLTREESAKLSDHLHSCHACTAYASEIKEAVSMLPPLMKRQWDAHLVPLPIHSLVEKRENLLSGTLLTMRTALVSLVVMALFFSAWQFVLSSPSPSSRPSSVIPPVPTPSNPTLQFVSTQRTLNGCSILSYTVQEQDTLSSIARKFSVSERTIVEFNQLESKSIHAAIELMIPLCHFTPTGTFYAATFTTTLTPVLNFRTSTPGG